MAKRYYEDKKMSKKGEGSGKYHPLEDESLMIKNDYNAPSNLPQASFMKMYPSSGSYDVEGRYADTLSGIDEQMHDTSRGVTNQKLPASRRF